MAYKQVLLGDFFKFEKGLGYKGEFLAVDSEVGLVGIDSQVPGGGYKENSEKPYSGPYKPEHVVQSGDVIVTSTDITQDGSVLGSTFMIPESTKYETLIYSGDVLKVIPTKPEEFSPEYLYNLYRVEKYRRKLAYGDTGTTVRRISDANLNEQLVPLPDLKTQESINEIIALIDQQIENNKSLAKNLEALAQSVFRSWFVDFEPVHAKDRGEKPFGMDDETAKLFPDSFEESELGLIPAGWGTRTIGDSVKKQKPGKLYDSKTTRSSGLIPVLDQGRSGFVGFHDDTPGVMASPDSPYVVFANHTCLLRLIAYPFSVIQNVFPLLGVGVDTIWLYFAVKGKQQFDSYKGHWPDFVLHLIIHPDEVLTNKFREIVNPLMKQKWNIEAENVQLEKLVEALLANIVDGNVNSLL